MPEFKYLILKDRLDVEYPILWPVAKDPTDYRSGVSHKEVASVHRASGVRVISAGMCQLSPKVATFGRSESLNMDGRPEDAAVIAAVFSPEPVATRPPDVSALTTQLRQCGYAVCIFNATELNGADRKRVEESMCSHGWAAIEDNRGA